MHESIPSVYNVPVEKDPARYRNSYFQQQWMPLKPFTCKIIIYYASIFSHSVFLKRHIQWKRIRTENVIQVIFRISEEEDLCLEKVSLFVLEKLRVFFSR